MFFGFHDKGKECIPIELNVTAQKAHLFEIDPFLSFHVWYSCRQNFLSEVLDKGVP